MTGAVAVIRNQGEGEQLWFAGGGVFTMKATAAETGHAFFLFEDHVVRGKVTPEHLHPNVDELVYVLEGEIIAPRGVAHAFIVTSDTARLLCLQTPGSGEAFYRSVSDPATSPSDAGRPPDLARLRAGAAVSDSVELLGPPPFATPPA
jgi:hypothetical protein